MKMHITKDKEIAEMIREGLKENKGYCPCVLNSNGQKDYKCPCRDFRENTLVNQSCHCGLYIKDEQ